MQAANKILTDLVTEYCVQYPKLRREHESLSNLNFNTECGLRLMVPREWDLPSVIPQVVGHFNSTVIVYNSVDTYEKLRKMFGDPEKVGVTYISWHEIYYAMFTKPTDTRPLQRANQLLNSSAAVVVCCASDMSHEVLYHIKAFSTGCLICLD
jgi:hypothetical protein